MLNDCQGKAPHSHREISVFLLRRSRLRRDGYAAASFRRRAATADSSERGGTSFLAFGAKLTVIRIVGLHLLKHRVQLTARPAGRLKPTLRLDCVLYQRCADVSWLAWHRAKWPAIVVSVAVGHDSIDPGFMSGGGT